MCKDDEEQRSDVHIAEDICMCLFLLFIVVILQDGSMKGVQEENSHLHHLVLQGICCMSTPTA